MIGKLFVICLVALISSESVSATTSNFVCYHGTWAKYRLNLGTFNVNTIDTSHCTHLVYSFIGLKTDGTVYSLDEYLDYDLGNLNAFTALKSKRSDLKVLVAIGGWSQSATFPAVAASATARATFLQSALAFIQTHGFDGFDFDWEYPNKRGGTAVDIQNFVTLCKEFKEAFEPLGLLLTAAVSATATSISTSYDVPAISQYLDMINVMTYDLRGAWDGVTGHNAPLYASSIDVTATQLELNVAACITNWIAQGADPAKLNLGVPFYGRTFTLSSTNNVALGAPVNNAGNAGVYTQESGYLGYNEIVELINQGGWTYVWDNEQQVPHMYKGDQWVGFDDPASITLKVKFAQSLKLGGVMVWAIETDDFNALSGTKNPLLTAMTNQLAAGCSNHSATTTTTTVSSNTDNAAATAAATNAASTAATATTTVASTTNSQSSSSICTTTGYVRDPSNCNKFYLCNLENGVLVAHSYTCVTGLKFDLASSTCNWATFVTDC